MAASVGKYIVDAALTGYSCSVFAYGQTGSGKTFTMVGDTTNYQLATGGEKEMALWALDPVSGEIEPMKVRLYMAQLLAWVTAGQLRVARVETFGFASLPAAHALIQGGQSVGKIVCETGA